jgi:O-antigen/teichoic acid export membrane protein
MTLGPFATRVAGVFATRVGRFLISFITSLLMARLLGPAGRGAFYLATITPTMLVALGQLGLPSAISFFAGRGRSAAALERTSYALAVLLSGILLVVGLLAMPWLETNVLKATAPELVRIALISLPFQFLASFAGATLIGKQRLRNYNLILVAQSAINLVALGLVVGVLGLGVPGAVVVNVAVAGATAAAIAIELRLSASLEPPAQGIRPGELLGYATRVYPASVTSYFSYRVDVFLISALLADATALGLYSLAVSLAELTFFVPDAVSLVFFPRVASSDRRTADELAPSVSRFTVLVTILSVACLIPAAFLAVSVVLPAFTGALPAFLVILPGVVALSVSKVLSSYINGLGLPTPVAVVSTIALGVNVAGNLLLIPRIGIVGAAAASLISYSAHAAMLVVISSRLSGRGPLAYIVPGRAELDRLSSGISALRRRPERPDLPAADHGDGGLP